MCSYNISRSIIMAKVKTYCVEITRVSYSSQEFEVEAKSKREAKDLEMDMAYNSEFSVDDADYKVNGIELIED